MDATRTRRTRDRARQAWYARQRQRRFARFLGFAEPTPSPVEAARRRRRVPPAPPRDRPDGHQRGQRGRRAPPRPRAQPGPSAGASDRKVARKASVPRFPRGTAAAIRLAAAGPASAWVATSRASVVAGNGVSSPAHPAPAASRRSVTRIRQAAGASALDSDTPRRPRRPRRLDPRPAARRPRPPVGGHDRRRRRSPPARPYPTSGSPPSPAATAA